MKETQKEARQEEKTGKRKHGHHHGHGRATAAVRVGSARLDAAQRSAASVREPAIGWKIGCIESRRLVPRYSREIVPAQRNDFEILQLSQSGLVHARDVIRLQLQITQRRAS